MLIQKSEINKLYNCVYYIINMERVIYNRSICLGCGFMNSEILELSRSIATDSIYICRELIKLREYSIADQLKRSCTSVGANIVEAMYAESKRDFIHKLNISIKECSESIFWIRTIKDNSIIEDEIIIKRLYNNCFSIKRLLWATIKTTKKTLSK